MNNKAPQNPKITISQIKEIRKIDGEIEAHREIITQSQKIIDKDWKKLTIIFDEIYKTAKIENWD